jgi:hypothetical protein
MLPSTRLFGDGTYGHAEQIQTFRGPACRTTFTSRRNTPFYRLKTPSRAGSQWCCQRLSEGLDPSAAERVFGFRQATITIWLTRAGEHAQTMHEHFFSHLHLPHLQLDDCAPGCAAPSRFSGSLWRSIPSPRFFRCLRSVPAPNTWPIGSSIPCDRSWLPVAFPSLPVMGSISTSLPSRLTLVGGSSWVVEDATCADGRLSQASSTAR